MSDAAIMRARGLELREITPEEYLSYFGNGFATMASYVEQNPDVIEGFGRALVRGTEFGMDEANQEVALEHMKSHHSAATACAVCARFQSVM